MKQFYETYKDDEFVTPLVTQISWTNHLLIMSGSKTADERHFYMALCAKEHYSKRELERQIGTSYYERSMISAKKPMPESVSHDVRESILDTYVLEFLDLPEQFSEKNLRKAIIENLKQFILEFGRDFTFIGEEYRVQVGNTDFFIDLLFYNRALSCLVPIELKIGKFKPEHIGQINFYRNEEFIYREYTVMQPLQRSYAITEERIEAMLSKGSLSSLYDQSKVDELENAEELTGKDQKKLEAYQANQPLYEAIIAALNEAVAEQTYNSPAAFMPVLNKALSTVTADKKLLEKIADGLSSVPSHKGCFGDVVPATHKAGIFRFSVQFYCPDFCRNFMWQIPL